MRIRKPSARVCVAVEGPRVLAVVSPEQVEAYLFDTGWRGVYAHEEPRQAAPWFDAIPLSAWQERWPQDIPVGFERPGVEIAIASPYYRRVRLGSIVDAIGRIERRAPSDVLADILGEE